MTTEDAPSPETPTEEPPAELQKDWDSLKEGLKLPRMTDDELRKFVDDFTSGRIFTSAQLSKNEVEKMLTLIFMPLAFGALSKYNPESLDSIGVIWENMSAASPRAINGRPTFFSCRFMHKDDWERAKKAIIREEERRSKIEV